MFKFFNIKKEKNGFRKRLSTKELAKHLEAVEKLKGGFDLVSDQVIITDSDANVIYANKAVEKNTGFTPEQVLGKNPADLWGGEMPDMFYEDMWRTIKFEKKPFIGKIKNKQKDGTEYWQEIHISPVLDENGEVKFFIGIEPNISAEEGERSLSEKGLSLLSFITKAIFVESYDLNSALNTTLKSLCTFAGWAMGEAWIPDAEGKNLELSAAWYGTPQLEKFVDASRDFKFAGGVGLPGRVWKTKKYEWIENVSALPLEFFLRADIAKEVGLKAALGMPIMLDGEVIAVIAVFMFEEQKSDPPFIALASEVVRQLGIFIRQKKLEDALKKSQKQIELEKMDFISLAGHQLKNPLAVVRWSLESLMKEKNLTPGQKEMLERIYGGNQMLIGLTNDLISISRIEGGETKMEIIDLAETIKQILANLKREKHGVLFSFSGETKMFPIKANKILAVQLFSNIITNAINYSSKEDGEIKISLKKEGDKRVFTCKDNGIGIPVDEQERVFSKFFRASNTAGLKQGGTGLGLFIAKKICDGFGWEISFKSPAENGRGTIFSVKIPQSPSS